MSEPVHILLVEDNHGDARLLAEHLRFLPSFQTRMERVEHLDAARAHLAGTRPDVVLLDLSLPDAQGIETVKGALQAAPEVPIVVLTGLDDEEVAMHAVQAGAQDYLVKAHLEPMLLSRSIRYAIERKRGERERYQLLAQEQEARGRAEAALRARDSVLQVLSHDLGNHLAAIQLYAGMLSRHLPVDETWSQPLKWAGAIQELAGQMQQLRETILDASQIEAGRMSLTLLPLDAGGLLRSIQQQISPLAEAKGVALHVTLAPGLPSFRGDRQRLLQMLGNLAGNAIKFTPRGGEVSLRAEADRDGVRLSVADTGPGISAEDLPRVFESFWKTRVGNPGGTGLGLSIARGIVELHGGRIWAESEVGRGSVFLLTLPTDVDDADSA